MGTLQPTATDPSAGRQRVGTASPPQRSHHRFLPPGFKVGKKDASPR